LCVVVTKERKGAARIKLKRAYEKPSRGDGSRILVERLWPRGLTQKRYWKELEEKEEAVQLLKQKGKQGAVTLVYAARDEEHNGALALLPTTRAL